MRIIARNFVESEVIPRLRNKSVSSNTNIKTLHAKARDNHEIIIRHFVPKCSKLLN